MNIKEAIDTLTRHPMFEWKERMKVLENGTIVTQVYRVGRGVRLVSKFLCGAVSYNVPATDHVPDLTDSITVFLILDTIRAELPGIDSVHFVRDVPCHKNLADDYIGIYAVGEHERYKIASGRSLPHAILAAMEKVHEPS